MEVLMLNVNGAIVKQVLPAKLFWVPLHLNNLLVFSMLIFGHDWVNMLWDIFLFSASGEVKCSVVIFSSIYPSLSHVTISSEV